MFLMILVFLICVGEGIREYCNDGLKETLGLGFGIGICAALCVSLVAGVLTTTLDNSYYAYAPARIELTPLEDKYIALDGGVIYYISDNEVRLISASNAVIKATTEPPHAVYYTYHGFNAEHWWALIYTFPNGEDLVEFNIPDGAISTKYHFGGKK